MTCGRSGEHDIIVTNWKINKVVARITSHHTAVCRDTLIPLIPLLHSLRAINSVIVLYSVTISNCVTFTDIERMLLKPVTSVGGPGNEDEIITQLMILDMDKFNTLPKGATQSRL